MAKINIDELHEQRMAGRKEEFKSAPEVVAEPSTTSEKAMQSFIEQNIRYSEVSPESKHRVSFPDKSTGNFDKNGVLSNLTKEEQAEFNRVRAYRKTGVMPKEKQKYSSDSVKGARLDPRVELAVFTGDEDEQDRQAAALLAEMAYSKPKEAVKEKHASQSDIDTARIEAFATANSKKEMGVAMKIALQKRGYNID